MPDPIQTPTASEIAAPVVPQEAATPVAAPGSNTPQAQARAALYERLYAPHPPSPPLGEPAPPPSPQAEPIAPTGASPSEDANGSPSPQQQTEPPAVPQPYLDAISALQAQVEALSARLPAQVPVAVPTAPAEAPVDPMAFLAAGDVKGFVNALRDQVRQEVIAEVGPQASQTAYTQAMEATRIEREVTDHYNRIRAASPEIAKAEGYFLTAVDNDLKAEQAAALASGKPWDASTKISKAKSIMDRHSAALREIFLGFRAAGADAALTRNREVVAATPLAPTTAPAQPPSQPANQAVTVDVSPQTYIANRWARTAGMRGRG